MPQHAKFTQRSLAIHGGMRNCTNTCKHRQYHLYDRGASVIIWSPRACMFINLRMNQVKAGVTVKFDLVSEIRILGTFENTVSLGFYS